MGTRARFVCNSVTNFPHGPNDVNLRVEMEADTNSNEHNFTRYTPCGSLSMDVTNPALGGFFIPGKTYYLDFTPVE